MSRFRASLARLMMAITSAVLIGPAMAFAGIAVAHASVDCAVGDPPWYEVSVSNKDVLDTNKTVYFTLGPDTSATRTLTHTGTWGASLTISVGTSADASIIIASAKLKVGVSLQAVGSVTDTDSVAVTANNNTSKTHDYVFFGGTRAAKGNWTRYYCSAGVVKVAASGTWFSWNNQYYGALRCDNDAAIKTQYGEWSVQYEAVTSC